MSSFRLCLLEAHVSSLTLELSSSEAPVFSFSLSLLVAPARKGLTTAQMRALRVFYSPEINWADL